MDSGYFDFLSSPHAFIFITVWRKKTHTQSQDRAQFSDEGTVKNALVNCTRLDLYPTPALIQHHNVLQFKYVVRTENEQYLDHSRSVTDMTAFTYCGCIKEFVLWGVMQANLTQDKIKIKLNLSTFWTINHTSDNNNPCQPTKRG